jgi:hypothetical protein
MAALRADGRLRTAGLRPEGDDARSLVLARKVRRRRDPERPFLEGPPPSVARRPSGRRPTPAFAKQEERDESPVPATLRTDHRPPATGHWPPTTDGLPRIDQRQQRPTSGRDPLSVALLIRRTRRLGPTPVGRL